MANNILYYGDNLDVLRRHVRDESVDLVYLDPPFNSNADYNVLFGEKDGKQSAAQVRAFEDTWRWDETASATYYELLDVPGKLHDTIHALWVMLGPSDMMAYLVMMAPRLVELRRAMKPTASIYLHCDPTASHYLKVLMDAVFGGENFRNEIVWARTASKGLMTRRLPDNHDVILAYQKSTDARWFLDAAFQPYDLENLDPKTAARNNLCDADGRLYRLSDLTNPNHNRPNLTYQFLGVTKVWRWTRERMQAAYEAGLIVQPSPGAVPRLKRYLDEQRGKPLNDVWTDIPPLNSQAKERLGYPTQKPEALLSRIIRLTTEEGDTVLDPFCGCGTAIAAAQNLGRKWSGIDITHLAITLIKQRLHDSFPDATFTVVGEPVDQAGAEALAAQDPYQFQWWALGLVGARPTEQKKGADKGIDGRIYFRDLEHADDVRQIILSVKAGHTQASHVRDLRGVLDREEAAIGVLIAMQEPTKPMRTEAATAGFYHSEGWNRDYPRIQILTIEDLLAGKKIDYPPSRFTNVTFKKAPKVTGPKKTTLDLL